MEKTSRATTKFYLSKSSKNGPHLKKQKQKNPCNLGDVFLYFRHTAILLNGKSNVLTGLNGQKVKLWKVVPINIDTYGELTCQLHNAAHHWQWWLPVNNQITAY